MKPDIRAIDVSEQNVLPVVADNWVALDIRHIKLAFWGFHYVSVTGILDDKTNLDLQALRNLPLL